MSARLGAVALVVVGLGLAGCGTGAGTSSADPAAGAADASRVAATTPSAPAVDRLVLISGRDDHGMVADERVPLRRRVEGRQVAGRVPDGTYAQVLETDGQWLRVETVEGRRLSGWVDDFFLRGESRLVGPAPSCRVRLDGRWHTGGTLVVVRAVRGDRARVATVSEPTVRGWVRRGALQELPPQGSRCGDVPVDDKHAHQH